MAPRGTDAAPVVPGVVGTAPVVVGRAVTVPAVICADASGVIPIRIENLPIPDERP